MQSTVILVQNVSQIAIYDADVGIMKGGLANTSDQ